MELVEIVQTVMQYTCNYGVIGFFFKQLVSAFAYFLYFKNNGAAFHNTLFNVLQYLTTVIFLKILNQVLYSQA